MSRRCAQHFFFTGWLTGAFDYLHSLFSANSPEDEEVGVYKDKPVTPHETFQAVFHYEDFEFDHQDKFGVRGYVYDVESTGKSAILTVSTVQFCFIPPNLEQGWK